MQLLISLINKRKIECKCKLLNSTLLLCFETSSVFHILYTILLTPVLARSSRALNYSNVKFFVGFQKKFKVVEIKIISTFKAFRIISALNTCSTRNYY